MLSFTMIYHFVLVGCLSFQIGLSLPIDTDGMDPDSEKIVNEFASELTSRRFLGRGEKSDSHDTMDFPEEHSNYDYEFSDVGDLFDYIADRDASHLPVKRYSDATATDMRSRLERLKLFKAQQKFLQNLMGKRNDREPFSYLLDYFQQKMKNGQAQYDEILDEIQRDLGDEYESDESMTNERYKRDATLLYDHRLAVARRLRAERKLNEFLQTITGGYRRAARNSSPLPAELLEAMKGIVRNNSF